MNRRHLAFCVAICLEAAGCFAVPVFVLFFGILYLPLLVLGLVRGSPLFLMMVGLTLLGSAGIAGVIRILVLLCRRREHDPRRVLTLSALACGTAATLIFVMWGMRGTSSFQQTLLTIVCLPLACTLHLVYLARRPLFSIGRGEP